MDENNSNIPQDKDVSVQAGTQANRVRIGFVFLSVVPVAILMAIQTLAQIPFLILAAVDVISDANVSGSDLAYMDSIIMVFNDKYAAPMYLIYAVASITVFLIWYYRGFVRKNPRIKLGEIFGIRSVIASICIAFGLYLFINALLTLVSWIAPDVIESYNQMIETAGLTTNSVITIFYAVILGPVAEELCFRGVVFEFLKKSGISPMWIILISSILFGAMHIIPVQVMYATVIGLFLGFLRYKYRSVLLTLATHILFNFTGTYISGIIDSLGLGDGVLMILGGVAAIVLVVAVILVNGDKKAYKRVHNS